MSLKKRAVEGIVVAGSLVMMSAIADAADVTWAQQATVAVETRTDLATNGTAGVIARLNEFEMGALESAETAGVEKTSKALVATAEEQTDGTVTPDSSIQPLAGVSAEVAQMDTGIPADGAQTDQAVTADGTRADGTVTPDGTQTDGAVTVDGTQTDDTVAVDGTQTDSVVPVDETSVDTMSEEEQEWQNRLMADVQDFLYVRAEGDENARIVGKLYKGAVAEIEEVGDVWTHVESGNVDGYVMNSYCLFGADAWNYANETFEMDAEIQTDGLRIRSSADPEASVIAAVSTGMTFPVDTSVEEVEGWVAIDYKGSIGYVSADYVTTELALGVAITIEEEQEQLAKEAAEAAKSAQVSSAGTVQNGAVAASVDDVTLLAALIQCEAGNECYEGQLAVGAVVMNRVRSGGYPGSIYGVVYQPSQFPPAGRGSVASIAANGPKASCIQAAQEAINGADNTGGATCFSRASSGHPGVVIGNHVFY